MTTESGEYYLYRHVRLDKNVPFYIGIGAKNKKDIKYNYYNRSVTKSGRSNLWKKVVAKTDYVIEIVRHKSQEEKTNRKLKT